MTCSLRKENDLRTIFLEKLGMCVIRFENCEVMENPELFLDQHHPVCAV